MNGHQGNDATSVLDLEFTHDLVFERATMERETEHRMEIVRYL